MKKIKILYAEDEISTRKEHIYYIQNRYSCDTYEASDGLEALKLFKLHQPQIVLTDIEMPFMDGLEFIQEIRKISKHTKIIVLTAYSEQKKLLQAIEMNVVNYIVKPINRKNLSQSIDTAIDTLQVEQSNDDEIIYLDKESTINLSNGEYLIHGNRVKLTHYEDKLLQILSKHINQKISNYEIFLFVWDDFDAEYSPESVRTLVKNLRKKLPSNTLENFYGGYYKLLSKL